MVLDNEHVLHTLGAAGGLVANLRSQILANGLLGVAAFCRGVRNAAAEAEVDGQEIHLGGLRAAAALAGAELTVRVRLAPLHVLRANFVLADKAHLCIFC